MLLTNCIINRFKMQSLIQWRSIWFFFMWDGWGSDLAPPIVEPPLIKTSLFGFNYLNQSINWLICLAPNHTQIKLIRWCYPVGVGLPYPYPFIHVFPGMYKYWLTRPHSLPFPSSAWSHRSLLFFTLWGSKTIIKWVYVIWCSSF